MNKTLKQIIDIFQESECTYICDAIRNEELSNEQELLDFVENVLFKYNKKYIELFNPPNITAQESYSLFEEIIHEDNWKELYREVRLNFLNWLYETTD